MHSNRKYSEKEVRLMNVLKGIVIIIYIILGAALGILQYLKYLRILILMVTHFYITII